LNPTDLLTQFVDAFNGILTALLTFLGDFIRQLLAAFLF